MTQAAVDGSKGRLAWIDFAKGASIVLVVFYHSALLMREVFPGLMLTWREVTSGLAPLRMPLFFVISGFLSAKLLDRPLRDSFQRTGGLYLIYLFWTVAFLVWLLLAAVRDGIPLPPPERVLQALLTPTTFWYIWALAALHLIAWFVWQAGRERTWLILIPLVAISFFGLPIDREARLILAPPLDDIKAGAIVTNAVWFFAGIYFRDHWSALIARASMTRLCASGLVYLVAVFAVHAYSHKALLTMQTPLALIALFFAANVLGLMDYSTTFARFMTWVGTRTLPVYIFHLLGLGLLSGWVRISGIGEVLREHATLVDLIGAPLVAGLLLGGALLAGELFERFGLRALITPPRLPMRRRVLDATS